MGRTSTSQSITEPHTYLPHLIPEYDSTKMTLLKMVKSIKRPVRCWRNFLSKNISRFSPYPFSCYRVRILLSLSHHFLVCFLLSFLLFCCVSIRQAIRYLHRSPRHSQPNLLGSGTAAKQSSPSFIVIDRRGNHRP